MRLLGKWKDLVWFAFVACGWIFWSRGYIKVWGPPAKCFSLRSLSFPSLGQKMWAATLPPQETWLLWPGRNMRQKMILQDSHHPQQWASSFWPWEMELKRLLIDAYSMWKVLVLVVKWVTPTSQSDTGKGSSNNGTTVKLSINNYQRAYMSWVWWHTPIILALRGQKQETYKSWGQPVLCTEIPSQTEGLGCSSVEQCLPSWVQSPVLKKGNHMDTSFIES